MASDIYLSSFGPWEPQFAIKGEPGWYYHNGRVFIQGIIDLAPNNQVLTKEQEKRIAAVGEASWEKEEEEKGNEVANVVSGPILLIPVQYAPPTPMLIQAWIDPFYTTPGFMVPVSLALAVRKSEEHDPQPKFFELVLAPTKIPPGPFGELRVILSCWWDTAGANNPGAGPSQPFEPENFTEAGGTIAHKGSRIWLAGDLTAGSEDEEREPPYLESWPFVKRLPSEEGRLHKVYPIGPSARIRGYGGAEDEDPPQDYSPLPSPDLPDGVGYTVGETEKQGKIPIKIDRNTDRGTGMKVGVIPTDRYSFYDVRAIPPGSKPQLGSYTINTPPNFGKPGQVRVSGPERGTGSSLFLGKVTLPTASGGVGNSAFSIYLAVPQSDTVGEDLKPGEGYFRLDLVNLLSYNFDVAPIINDFEYHPEPGDDWTTGAEPSQLEEYLGPKVIFNTINWNPEGGAGMEPPFYYETQVDETGNGHQFFTQSGWGWERIPDGPKSILASATNDATITNALRTKIMTERKEQLGVDGELPAQYQPPAGVTYVILEWGEVGILPSESDPSQRGMMVFWDPTTTFPAGREWPGPPAVPIFWIGFGIIFDEDNIQYEAFLERYAPFLLHKHPPDIIEVIDYQGIYDGRSIIYGEQEGANFEPVEKGISPIGEPGFSQGNADGGVSGGYPIWAGNFPLPGWNVMQEHEELRLDGAGYAGKPTNGTIEIGPGDEAVVPKS